MLSPLAALVITSAMAPMHPRATPPPFIQVMGSRSMANDSIMANMGMEVVMMLALLGEVMPSPMV